MDWHDCDTFDSVNSISTTTEYRASASEYLVTLPVEGDAHEGGDNLCLFFLCFILSRGCLLVNGALRQRMSPVWQAHLAKPEYRNDAMYTISDCIVYRYMRI